MATPSGNSPKGLPLEERLIVAAATGTVEEHEGLLAGESGDVDARGVGQRTLLHLAVSSGKGDWAEGLMGMGADPRVRDGEGLDVVRVAEDMCTQHPEDAGRRDILRMVRMVNKRDGAKRGADPGAVCGPGGKISRLEVSSIFDVLAKLSDEVASLKEGFSRLFLNEEGDEVTVSKMVQTSATNGNGLKLANVQSNVTSRAGDLRPSKEEVVDSLSGREGLAVLRSSVDALREQIIRVEEKRSGSDCVEAMMRMTFIMSVDNVKAYRVRGLFNNILCTNLYTSCILAFLKGQPWVRIMIDCDDFDIDWIAEKFTDHDELNKTGRYVHSFADFKRMEVYLGGEVNADRKEEHVAADFVSSLCQMAVFLAFDNGGRPYAEGDAVNEERFKGVVTEALKSKGEVEKQMKLALDKAAEGIMTKALKRRGEMDKQIELALDKATERAKEIYLIAFVPWTMAMYGSSSGTCKLREKLPSLLEYYEQHVMATLQHKSSPSPTYTLASPNYFPSNPSRSPASPSRELI